MWRTVDLHLHLAARFAPGLNAPMRTDFRLDALVWGAVAAFLLQNKSTRNLLQRRISRPVMVAFLAVFLICLSRPIPLAAVWQAIVVPLMLLSTVTHEHWWISRVLELKILRWVGRISYSLYLWQQMFLVPKWEPHVLPLVQNPQWAVAVAFLAATASYYVVEKPMIILGRSLVSRIRR